MRNFGIMSGIAGALMGIASLKYEQAIYQRHSYGGQKKSSVGRYRWDGIPAWMNRHTRKPHEHKREIARRQRQAAARA